MFDIGFSELMIIAVVALIVIGPERLPKVARTLGHLFGRMQRYVNDVKADISREMQLDELKKLQASMQDAARSFEDSVTREVNATESELQKIAQEANPLPAPAGETKADDTVGSAAAIGNELAPPQPAASIDTQPTAAPPAPASQAEAPRPALDAAAGPLDRRA
jgi:sec-independent protein translocase protein TatB